VENTQRFTNRVDTYVKYRPSYPKDAIDYLYEVVGLSPSSIVADIGAGTGIFSKLLLERGSVVTAIEPNQAMREAAESTLSGNPNFRMVSESAEHTGLADQSVDYIVSAQAFHWFDRESAQTEFRRILKPGGKVVLVWNARLTQGTPFLVEYEQLLRTYGTDYVQVNHRNISSDALALFFKVEGIHEAQFKYCQLLNFEELSGRLLSSSYSPVSGHPNHEPMMAELRKLFDQNEHEGVVSFNYETEVFWGEV
jgi:SAM-dependent methyltransferase